MSDTDTETTMADGLYLALIVTLGGKAPANWAVDVMIQRYEALTGIDGHKAFKRLAEFVEDVGS